jgi:Co/Zn/Cd efflux system component
MSIVDVVNLTINFVKDNWVEVLAIIGAVDIILGIVVKWTKWTWDDSVYAFLHNLIAKLVKK